MEANNSKESIHAAKEDHKTLVDEICDAKKRSGDARMYALEVERQWKACKHDGKKLEVDHKKLMNRSVAGEGKVKTFEQSHRIVEAASAQKVAAAEAEADEEGLFFPSEYLTSHSMYPTPGKRL